MSTRTHIPGVLWDELVIDSFAGGGGASLGIEMGLGRAVNIAINHDAEAVAMHAANHPLTDHYCQDVWQADPVQVTQGRPVGLAWFSPDCTYHSKARGGKPIRDVKRRDLAWVIIKWAKAVRPRVIMLENVEEFAQWGPLVDGRPCPRRRGRTFKSWKSQLTKLGYAVEHRELRACDYGTPTIRKRLFVIARCDGQPIVWPEVTHGKVVEAEADRAGAVQEDRARSRLHSTQVAEVLRAARSSKKGRQQVLGGEFSGGVCGAHGHRHPAGRLLPFRTAAECIDWSIPCPSVFLTKAEAVAYHAATGQRIIRPLKAKTMDRIRNGLMRYVVNAKPPGPFIVRCNHGGDHFRGQPVTKPFCTATAKRDAHGLIMPFVSAAQHGGMNRPANEPMHTVTASLKDQNQVVAAFIAQQNGEAPHQDMRGQAVNRPISTIACSNRHKLVAAFLAKHYTGVVGHEIDRPASTITTLDHHSLVAASLTELRGTSKDGQRIDEPAATITAGGNHAGVVAAFLQSYYGNSDNGTDVTDPLPTITTKDRLGVVTVEINGEPMVIADVGMRMLTPRELYRCQGFPDSYIIDPIVKGKPLSKSAQVRMCGNSVCPQVAAALVRANLSAVQSPEAQEVA